MWISTSPILPGLAIKLINNAPIRVKTDIEVSMTTMKTGGVETDKLKSYIERIERLEEEKSTFAADIREVYSEAKSSGFDSKAMREVVKLRKMQHNERMEQEYMLDLYKRALGLDIELEEAA
jgi:uncharacterized protein (UPF0335 family)